MSDDLKNRYLILCDFDGTLANTFIPSPHNIGVTEAYRLAAYDIFGDEGIKIYDSIGGFSNRATSELVTDILKTEPSLLQKARDLAEKRGLIMDKLEPEKTITELFVQVKLEKLSKEIGQKFPDGKVWPAPYDGVIEFFKEIERINSNGKIHLDVGILSSGHTEFIKKVFELWNIKVPQVMVTDDDIRKQTYPKEQFRRVKPNVFLFAYAHWKWLTSQGINPNNFDLAGAKELRNRIVYLGDDLVKDGDMAKEAKVPFYLFNPENNENLNGVNQFNFSEWSQFNKILKQPEVARRMREGISFLEILQSLPQELRGELVAFPNKEIKLPPIR